MKHKMLQLNFYAKISIKTLSLEIKKQRDLSPTQLHLMQIDFKLSLDLNLEIKLHFQATLKRAGLSVKLDQRFR
jgi:hypothetical protein